MKVLGVSYGYHDSTASLVIDGQVVAASAEERFTRQKHDSNFPAYAIDYCLSMAGLSTAEVDQVVFHEDPHAKFARVLTTSLAPFPTSRSEFVNSMKAWMGRKLWSLNTLSSRLDVPAEKISYLSHHFSHGVQAFMGSGFDEAAILVVDAVGDWASTALFKGRWEDGVPLVERVVEIAFPNSLGLVYSAFTAWLGFSPNDSECSTMALAAFGRPIYADKLREMIAALDDRTYQVDQSYFHFANFYKGAVSKKFIEYFGPSRPLKMKLPFCSFGTPKGEISSEHQRFADAAASVQLVLEERVLGLCSKLHDAVPSKNLCYAGGVSFNCVANYRILNESPFENLYIPPDPGDGGTAVGIALYCDAVSSKSEPRHSVYGPYLGAAFDARDDIEMLQYVKPDHVVPYLKRGLRQPPGLQWHSRTFDDDDALVEDVAQRLFDAKIVGWYQGRSEIGPRALGHRSILIRPDDVALAERLSRDVKDRAPFRPYAFSITKESAPQVLDIPPEHVRFNRWMQFAVPVRAEIADKLIAALHVDRTTRPQVCAVEENPIYHKLLTAFGRRSGIEALLNTSFNASGYPIVSTPVEALVLFARTDMDVLVLNRTVVWKDAR